jgi:acetylornithine deacetylase
MPGTAQRLDAVDRAIEAEADAACAFLDRLVRAPSTVGNEAGAQDVVAAELARLGFTVSRVPVPERTAAHPAAGVPQCSYAGRDNVLAGDWASSVPARARVGVRVGYPRRWTANEAFDQVRKAVLRAAAADPWLAGHPPVLRQTGFRAQGYLLRHDHPLVTAVADAHAGAHGDRPAHRVLGSTTDARYYLNQFGRPALAYGPTARNIHAPDEAVELASIVRGARTLARFIASFFAADGLPGARRTHRRQRVRS